MKTLLIKVLRPFSVGGALYRKGICEVSERVLERAEEGVEYELADAPVVEGQEVEEGEAKPKKKAKASKKK